jgi:hypothetical protein
MQLVIGLSMTQECQQDFLYWFEPTTPVLFNTYRRQYTNYQCWVPDSVLPPFSWPSFMYHVLHPFNVVPSSSTVFPPVCLCPFKVQKDPGHQDSS